MLVDFIGSLDALLLRNPDFLPDVLQPHQSSVEVCNRLCCVDLAGGKEKLQWVNTGATQANLVGYLGVCRASPSTANRRT